MNCEATEKLLKEMQKLIKRWQSLARCSASYAQLARSRDEKELASYWEAKEEVQEWDARQLQGIMEASSGSAS